MSTTPHDHHGHGHHHHHHDHHDVETGPPVFTDPAQESLSGALRAGFRFLSLIMIVLLVAYAASGYFQVNPGEQAVIVRFGELKTNPNPESDVGPAVFGPGLYFAAPDPIDEKIRLSGAARQERIDTFSFKRDAKDMNKTLADTLPQREQLRPGVDGTMLSGDRGLSHGLWTIEYRISDAEKFVRNVGDSVEAAERLLKRLSETAIVRTVAGLSIEEVTRTNLRSGIADFTYDVQEHISADLRDLESGMELVKVTAETIEPGRVREAALNVTKAQNERETAISQARREADAMLRQAAGPEYQKLIDAIEEYGAAQVAGADEHRLAALRQAIDERLMTSQGDVAVKLLEAESASTEARERMQREVEQYLSYREAFRDKPEATITGLWLGMRDKVLSSPTNELFYLPVGVSSVEILTNRDQERALIAEKERYERRYRPGNSGSGGGG